MPRTSGTIVYFRFVGRETLAHLEMPVSQFVGKSCKFEIVKYIRRHVNYWWLSVILKLLNYYAYSFANRFNKLDSNELCIYTTITRWFIWFIFIYMYYNVTVKLFYYCKCNTQNIFRKKIVNHNVICRYYLFILPYNNYSYIRASIKVSNKYGFKGGKSLLYLEKLHFHSDQII